VEVIEDIDNMETLVSIFQIVAFLFGCVALFLIAEFGYKYRNTIFTPIIVAFLSGTTFIILVLFLRKNPPQNIFDIFIGTTVMGGALLACIVWFVQGIYSLVKTKKNKWWYE
jgi:hypothetical protein